MEGTVHDITTKMRKGNNTSAGKDEFEVFCIKKIIDNVMCTLFYTNISDFSEDWVGMIYEEMRRIIAVPGGQIF